MPVKFLDSDKLNTSDNQLVSNAPKRRVVFLDELDPSDPNYEPTPEPVEDFTTTEKVISESAPILGGLLGSVSGAAQGAAIGSAVPVLGTAVGGVAGAIIGGAIGSGGGRALGDVMEAHFGGKDRPGSEIMKRSAREAGMSALIDVPLLGLGAAAKAVRPAVRGLSKNVRASRLLKQSNQRVINNKAKVQLKLDMINKEVSDANKAIKKDHAIKKAMSEGRADKALGKIGIILDKEVTKVSKEIAGASNQALKELGKEYDLIGEQFGRNTIELKDTIVGLNKLSKSNDPVIFQSMSKVKGLIKTLNAKKNGHTVNDAIALRRQITAQERKLYNSGGEVSGALAETLSEIRSVLDSKLSDSTFGLSGKLAERYKETINLAKSNKLFRGDLLKAGNLGMRNAEDIVQADIKGMLRESERVGDSFLKVGHKQALEIAQSGESIFDISNKSVLKIANQSKILRASKVPDMIKLADSIDESMINIARGQISKSNIKKSLKSIGQPEMVSNDLADVLESRLLKLKNLDVKQKDKLLKMGADRDVANSLLGTYIAGDTAARVLPGAVGKSIQGAVNLLAIKKWAPITADVLDPILEKYSKSLLSVPSFKNEALRQMMQTVVSDVSKTEN